MKGYRIVLLSSTLSKGGTTRFVVEVARRLLRRGHQVFIVSWYYNPRETFPEIKEIPTIALLRRGKMSSTAINMHQSMSRKHGRIAPTIAGIPISIVTNLLLATYALLKLKPDFIIVNTGHSLMCIVIALSRLLVPSKKVKFILYHHTPPPVPKWRAISWMISVFEKASMRVATPIANSKMTANAIKRRHGIIATVIHMGVNASTFKPVKEVKLSSIETPILLYVARFQSDKKQYFAIRLMKELKNRGLKVKLVLAGSLSSEFEYYFKKLKNFTNYLGISNHIEFRTNLSDKELLDLYNSSTIYIHVRPEAFGISILEALSCGKPVIVCKEGGQTDFVIHGINGFLAESSLHEWSYYIELLLHDKTLYAKMSRAARKVAEKFSWDKITDRIEILLRTLATQQEP